jgi:hypothetical protein
VSRSINGYCLRYRPQFNGIAPQAERHRVGRVHTSLHIAFGSVATEQFHRLANATRNEPIHIRPSNREDVQVGHRKRASRIIERSNSTNAPVIWNSSFPASFLVIAAPTLVFRCEQEYPMFSYHNQLLSAWVFRAPKSRRNARLASAETRGDFGIDQRGGT